MVNVKQPIISHLVRPTNTYRKADANKDLGRHHALDAYAIVGMMTESEYDRALHLAARSRSDPHFLRVCDVVAADFSSPTTPGTLRLREQSYCQMLWMGFDSGGGLDLDPIDKLDPRDDGLKPR